MGFGIGKRIKEKREKLGLTQMELAVRMGYKSKAAICKVERGDDNITSDRVSKFARALNCSESYLMGWSDEDESDNNVITLEEGQFIEVYRQLDEESKRQLNLYLAFLKDQNNKK